MSEVGKALVGEWTNIISTIATCAAVLVALFLHFHHLWNEKATRTAEDKRNTVIALQAIYSELRALDAYFMTIDLELYDLDGEKAVSILSKLGDRENRLDPKLPVDLVEFRMEVLSRLPIDQASHYSSAIARYRIIRDHARHLMDEFHGSSEALAEEQKRNTLNRFYRIAGLIRKAAKEGANHCGCLIAEAESLDPGLKPVSVSIESIRREVQSS